MRVHVSQETVELPFQGHPTGAQAEEHEAGDYAVSEQTRQTCRPGPVLADGVFVGEWLTRVRGIVMRFVVKVSW